MEIKTERLLIRPYNDQDFDAVASLLSHPQVMEFSKQGPLKRAQIEEYISLFFQNPLQENKGLWPLIDIQQSKLIGFAGLLNQTVGGEHVVELAYRLHPDSWGEGFAKEACFAILRYAKEQLSLTELVSIINVKNEPSVCLSKSLGFALKEYETFEGVKCAIYSKNFRISTFVLNVQEG